MNVVRRLEFTSINEPLAQLAVFYKELLDGAKSWQAFMSKNNDHFPYKLRKNMTCSHQPDIKWLIWDDEDQTTRFFLTWDSFERDNPRISSYMGIIWVVSSLKIHEAFIPEENWTNQAISLQLASFSEFQAIFCVFFKYFLPLFMEDVFGVTSLKTPCRYFKFLTGGTWNTFLGGGFKYFFFHPYLGKIPNLTNIFQRGWNHQPEYFWCWCS